MWRLAFNCYSIMNLSIINSSWSWQMFYSASIQERSKLKVKRTFILVSAKCPVTEIKLISTFRSLTFTKYPWFLVGGYFFFLSCRWYMYILLQLYYYCKLSFFGFSISQPWQSTLPPHPLPKLLVDSIFSHCGQSFPGILLSNSKQLYISTYTPLNYNSFSINNTSTIILISKCHK